MLHFKHRIKADLFTPGVFNRGSCTEKHFIHHTTEDVHVFKRSEKRKNMNCAAVCQENCLKSAVSVSLKCPQISNMSDSYRGEEVLEYSDYNTIN